MTSPALQPSLERPRDAVRTRQALLEVARRRFALDGYSATTSRDIAAEVGVNVALINRYFLSKEGLFEACLARTAEELAELERLPLTSTDIARRLIEQVAETSETTKPLQLLLLLRSSGDERADEIRRRTMRSYTERMAGAIGWNPEDPTTDSLLLSAQIAMALGFGVTLMRTSGDLQPLGSAQKEALERPLQAALAELLPASE